MEPQDGRRTVVEGPICPTVALGCTFFFFFTSRGHHPIAVRHWHVADKVGQFSHVQYHVEVQVRFNV
ncbi:hypothetical protein BD777DRAFT_121749 [Yarrowia lipolytica]|nr:hypothetical protein BD777DRAFT_121749 [Yarrowia lipolytica]